MPEYLDIERVQNLLTTRWLGRKIEYEEEVDSTNIRIKELAGKKAPQGTVYTAEIQTAGRGRRGRAWTSCKGEALAVSFLLYPQCEPARASMISLISGLSVVQACRDLGLPVQVKWPNDGVLNGKKICGILTEMQADQERIRYVVSGIGINVNQKSFSEELQGIASSMFLETGKQWEREQVMAAVLNHMEENYEIFLKTADMSGLKTAYEEVLINKGRKVRIMTGRESFTGTALGITDTGELLVETEDGKVQEVYAGEVSVRGIYGYV